MEVLRLFAIISIVWGHCLVGIETRQYGNANANFIQLLAIEFGRLGTVNFFLLSGYFLANKLQQHTVWSYLKYRSHTVILPWFLFLSVFVAFQVMHHLSWANVVTGKTSVTFLLWDILSTYRTFLFHTAFWFVPIAILSASVLIVFKKHIQNKWFGLALFFVALFYSINLYYGWVSVNHTRAFAGYIFYMWLGLQLNKHASLFNSILSQLKYKTLAMAIAGFFVIACWEAFKLKALHAADPFASLRLSNAILSMLIFSVALKSSRFDKLYYLHPQKYVYGVYLIHCLIITEFIYLFQFIIQKWHLQISELINVSLVPVQFILTFILSWVITEFIRTSRWRRVIGCIKI